MAFSDLGWEGRLVMAMTIIALFIMGGDWVGPDIVFPMLLALLIGARTVTAARGSSGYGNTGLLTVMSLYAVAEGIYQTGVLESIMLFMLGRSRSAFWANVRMMIPVMFVSAFLNNTPVVSLMTPILISWARRTGVAPKKLLIPLSYASVLGGTCTLIGTSTNLVVSGLQTSRYTKLKQLESALFRIFDIAPYGIPYAIWGFMFVLAVQGFLLPSNDSKFERDLLFSLRVTRSTPSRGLTLLQSGLLSVYGLKLVGVLRKGTIREPTMDLILEEGDILLFAGEISQAEFVSEEHALELLDHEAEKLADTDGDIIKGDKEGPRTSKTIQVTVKGTCPFVGSFLRHVPFRETFDAAVLAVKRGNRRDGPLGSVLLVEGDILVLDAGEKFDDSTPEFERSFKDVHHIKDAAAKEFIVPLRVLPTTPFGHSVDKAVGSDIIGKNVAQVGLRGIPGVGVVAVDRANGERFEIVDHNVLIEANDIIWFAADLAGVQFLSKFPGLEFTQADQARKTNINILYRTYVQAAISPRSHYIGQSIADLKFRTKIGAAVLAIHREEHRKPLDIKNTLLQSGDILLLETRAEWTEENVHNKAFIMLTPVTRSSPPKKNRGLLAVTLGIIMVLTQVIPGVRNDPEWINLWPCSVLTAGLMILSGCLSGDQYRWSFLWDIYLTIGAAFGVSAALEDTGVAKELANVFISIGRAVGTEGAALTSIYIATAFMSEILTNNAAGAVMYPIAAIAGDELGIDPKAMSVAIMLGASAGFINPFSYQCNLMVFVAGKYRTLEFAKIGLPFQIYLAIISSFILHYVDNWQQVWIISFIALGVFLGIPLLWAVLPNRFTIPIDNWAAATFSNLFSCFKKRKVHDYPAAPVARISSSGSDSGKDDGAKYAAQHRRGPAAEGRVDVLPVAGRS